MHVVIRLQNHGCKNHKLWWIVVAPRKRNIKGRFIEHVGYWVPHERKVVQRSVILNKPRIKYWLAQGAGVTPKIHRFLSWIDLLPPPLIKFGSKTLYDKPVKPNPLNTYNRFNRPKRGILEKQFYDQISETITDNDLKRKILYQQQKVEEIPATSAELESEWAKLRAEVYQIEKDNKTINPLKRELIFKKINEIAQQWYKEKQVEALKQISEKKMNIKVDSQNVKEQLMMQNLVIKTEQQMLEKSTWIEDLMPLTKEQVEEYVDASIGTNRKDEVISGIFEYAYETSQVVSRSFVDDFLRNMVSPIKIVSDEEHPNIKNDFIQKLHYIPVNRPVHPLPDLEQYDPEEYTDIKKESEQLIKNKSYSIPNTFLEPDLNEEQLNLRITQSVKSLKGRRVPPRDGIPKQTGYKQKFSARRA